MRLRVQEVAVASDASLSAAAMRRVADHFEFRENTRDDNPDVTQSLMIDDVVRADLLAAHLSGWGNLSARPPRG